MARYLMSIVECSKVYGIPRDKLYAASRAKNTEIPFIKLGNSKKINVRLLENLLDAKSANNEELFK